MATVTPTSASRGSTGCSDQEVTNTAFPRKVVKTIKSIKFYDYSFHQFHEWRSNVKQRRISRKMHRLKKQEILLKGSYKSLIRENMERKARIEDMYKNLEATKVGRDQLKLDIKWCKLRQKEKELGIRQELLRFNKLS